MIVDKTIEDLNDYFCKNIDKITRDGRGGVSQIILGQVRTFVEHIMHRAYCVGTSCDEAYTFDNRRLSECFCKSHTKFNFLYKFHNLLQQSTSHYFSDEEMSERLMLKYFGYLMKIRSLMENEYNISILENLEKFPVYIDDELLEYYRKIAHKLDELIDDNSEIKSERYYVQKVKPFVIDGKLYYEITLTLAYENVSKFDRIIVFSKKNIPQNYAIKGNIDEREINVFDKKMAINFLVRHEVSIRPCELNRFSHIVGTPMEIRSDNNEYIRLMQYMTISDCNLVDLIDLSKEEYNKAKKKIVEKTNRIVVFKCLDKCRKIVRNGQSGTQVIRYLLYVMNNKVLKDQIGGPCTLLSGLSLEWGCIPFDQMPYASSLKNHNPKYIDLLECIEVDGRDYELFARYIKNKTEKNLELYVDVSEKEDKSEIDRLIEQFNNKIYYKHRPRRDLEKIGNNVFINGYEADTFNIIKILSDLSSSGFDSYSESVESWLQNNNVIDDPIKKDILVNIFKNSRVGLIYGAAGTGKSRMLKHISDFFSDANKLYLANTNPAVNNLERNIAGSNCTYTTIAKYKHQACKTYDFIFIDECSTVSNEDMIFVLEKSDFEGIILVGDIHQIESISFGNWFNISRYFISEESIYELTNPFRTKNDKLKLLWDKVRRITDDIEEHLVSNNYTKRLDDSIFRPLMGDEIILCLNYDGLYGINNINRFLQNNNPNPAIGWGITKFKVNDPVIFNENNNYAPAIHNNLKGNIVKVEKRQESIYFEIEIDKVINSFTAKNSGLELIGLSSNDKSIVGFLIDKPGDSDYDATTDRKIVPFQVAYAVSIHKAQGLEYDSVKVIISNEVEERVDYNIFYTAITRAKEKLNIYWSPETEHKVIENFAIRDSRRDAGILQSRKNIRMKKVKVK